LLGDKRAKHTPTEEGKTRSEKHGNTHKKPRSLTGPTLGADGRRPLEEEAQKRPKKGGGGRNRRTSPGTGETDKKKGESTYEKGN